MADKRSSVSRSRSTFAANFRAHHCALFLGAVPCCGQLCQKQPSTKTATRRRVKSRSARRLKPLTGSGASTRYRNPSRCRARRNCNSGLVPTRFCVRIRADAAASRGRGLDGVEPRVVLTGHAANHIVVVETIPYGRSRRAGDQLHRRDAIVHHVDHDDAQTVVAHL